MTAKINKEVLEKASARIAFSKDLAAATKTKWEPSYGGLETELAQALLSAAESVEELEAKLSVAREALEFYAGEEKWGQFISSGGVFDEQDGDFVAAFNDGDDNPGGVARTALAIAASQLTGGGNLPPTITQTKPGEFE